ncbi:hypothetical protein IGI04_008878 [Brassica rapa subsp. trilocularis]|uniref:ABC transmembrane type-1 domain-containing protein n=1 Tax=Brassica rapa subsp. trilocularis TaxID=1813537 RepID=A0ABQ7MVQ2_BRACM|nr:hypothetical protein IGI04_008878 [Brassica rapa subsp. trilocularis]
MEHVLLDTMIMKESFKVMLGEIVPELFMSYIQYLLSTLGVVYAAAQLSRPVVPRLQRSINRLRACVTEHIFGETDEYMIFGWIGATGLYFGFLFGLREVTGVTIWYQSGVPSRPRPGMAIRGFGFLRFLFKGSTQMFSSRCVMSQFISCLRSVISSFGHDSEIIQEWICDVSASTLLQAIVPRVLSREITWYEV